MCSSNTTYATERSISEAFWVSQYNFLLCRGYELRGRYSPDWVPSWVLNGVTGWPKVFLADYTRALYARVVMDARRVSDGQKVVLKRVDTRTNEIQLLSYLSHPDRRNDPRNHIVPLLDVIPRPDNDEQAFIVLPYLMRINHLPFRRVGEVGEALEQLFEAVEYLHAHDIIHGDACFYNYVVDASKMVPDGWHFAADHYEDDGSTHIKWKDRTQTRPNKYYLIDFDLSLKVENDEGRWLTGNWGQDRTVPEMSLTEPCDGFKVDVYQMGNVINDFLEMYTGLEVFKTIADKLTARDPDRRPSAASAVHLIRYLNAKLSPRKRACRIWQKGLTSPDFKTRFWIRFFNHDAIN